MDIKKLLKTVKLHESTISMVLGSIVIVTVGVLLINFFAQKRGETIPPFEIGDETALPTSHTVQAGENLWVISEKYYDSGYNWVDIASANNILNPNDIEEGQTLTIPDVKPRTVAEADFISPTSEPTKVVVSEPEPTSVETEETKYKVEKGDNLWKIAEKFYSSGYSWVDISKANKLDNPGVLEAGQELVIPNAEAKKATDSSQDKISEAQAITGATYAVKKGDTLWAIAVRAYGDGYKWTEIAKENGLKNPNLIHSGNLLSLPR